MKCKFLALTPTPFPVVKGCVCLVGFASLQSPWAYTPGIHAGAECGAAALTLLGATPQTPFSKIVNTGTGAPTTRLGATPQTPY